MIKSRSNKDCFPINSHKGNKTYLERNIKLQIF